MENHNAASTKLYSELKEITEQKTNCLFEYLRQVQELNTRMRQLQLSDELMSMAREHDQKLKDILLREGK